MKTLSFWPASPLLFSSSARPKNSYIAITAKANSTKVQFLVAKAESVRDTLSNSIFYEQSSLDVIKYLQIYKISCFSENQCAFLMNINTAHFETF